MEEEPVGVSAVGLAFLVRVAFLAGVAIEPSQLGDVAGREVRRLRGVANTLVGIAILLVLRVGAVGFGCGIRIAGGLAAELVRP